MLSRFGLSGTKKSETSREEVEDEEGNENQDATSEENDEEEDEDDDEVEAYLIPSEHEKKAVLASFDVMRKDSLFCDISFVCQGILFRAHKVIVSSWSRWLKAFLCESPEEEVLSLDIFDPEAFRAVLDYMYGVALQISVQNAESIIKVARRLELVKLEQQCWRYLITILNAKTNCEYLHDLADRFDCPPLKLAAWKILKEKVPDTSVFPRRKNKKNDHLEMLDAKRNFSTTGLTGPADTNFRKGRTVQPGITFGLDPNEDDYHPIPSIFDDHSEHEDDEEHDHDDDDDDDDHDTVKKRLEDLDKNAPAADVINAWAHRLKEVYTKCASIETLNTEEPRRLQLSEDTPNVKLHKSPRKRTNNNHNQDDNQETMHQFDNPNENLDQQSHNNKSTFSPTNNVPPSHAAKSLDNLRYYHSAGAIEWDVVLNNFYTFMNMPNKINGIPTILKTWSHKEDEMLSSLMEKYDKQIPKKLMKYLQHVVQLAETRTDSSFHKHAKGDRGRPFVAVSLLSDEVEADADEKMIQKKSLPLAMHSITQNNPHSKHDNSSLEEMTDHNHKNSNDDDDDDDEDLNDPIDFDLNVTECLARFYALFRVLKRKGLPLLSHPSNRQEKSLSINSSGFKSAVAYALKGDQYLAELQVDIQYVVLQAALILTISLPLYIDPPSLSSESCNRAFSALMGCSAFLHLYTILACSVLTFVYNQAFTKTDAIISSFAHEHIYFWVRRANLAADVSALLAAFISAFSRNVIDGSIQLYAPFLVAFSGYLFFSRLIWSIRIQDERVWHFYRKYCQENGELKPKYLTMIQDAKAKE